MPPHREPLPLRHAIALGLAQGPTELLPVSSSAHTALLPWLAGWPYASLDSELRKSFEVAVHAGAGCALAIVMRDVLRRQVATMDGRRAWVLALSLAPPALAGYLLGGSIERRLGGPRSIAAALAAGALAMTFADVAAAGRARGVEDARAADGLALGLAQAAALIPGVSRNGATLAAARARGFARDDAQALSWSVALPVVLGATALKGRRLARADTTPQLRTAMAAGAGAAFVSTLVSATVLGPRRAGARALLPYSVYRSLLAALVVRRLRRARQRPG
jgi:undecaprenyl-diphosphatase